MTTKLIKVPHPDTKAAVIEVYWDDREIFCDIFTKNYDETGKEYKSNILLEKAQLLALIAILTQAHNEMLDETGN
jgi:hypothetical protein